MTAACNCTRACSRCPLLTNGFQYTASGDAYFRCTNWVYPTYSPNHNILPYPPLDAPCAPYRWFDPSWDYKAPVVLPDIQAEMKRQDDEFGVQHHSPSEWLTILVEEVGEVARAINEFGNGDPLGARLHLRDELVQVAAVATQIVKALDEGRV